MADIFLWILIDVTSPGGFGSGGLWRPVAACGGCGVGIMALLEDCITEAWRPGGLELRDLEARMMRLRMRMMMMMMMMMMNDGEMRIRM